jgi:hypothetical protein
VGRHVRSLTAVGLGGFVVAVFTLPVVDPRTLLWPPTTLAIAAALGGLLAVRTSRAHAIRGQLAGQAPITRR